MELTLKQKTAFGIGAVGKDMVYALSASYVMYYYQDVLGLSASFVGLVLMAARFFDAFNDPFMGVLVAKTRTRWGRFRPWIFSGTLLNALVLYALFAAPVLDEAALMVYFSVMYILWGVTYTMMDIPYWSMIPAVTRTPKDRENLSMVGRTCAGVGSALIAMFTMLLVGILGGDSERTGFRWVALIVAVIFAVTELVCCISMKETTPSEMKTATVKEMFSALFRNDQAMVVVGSIVLINSALYLTSNFIIYFFKYDLGGAGWKATYTLFSTVGGAAQILGMMVLYPLLRKKFSSTQVFHLSLVLALCGYGTLLVFCLTGLSHSLALLCIPGVVVFACNGMLTVLTTLFLSNSVDYGQLKTGRREESKAIHVMANGIYSACFLRKRRRCGESPPTQRSKAVRHSSDGLAALIGKDRSGDGNCYFARPSFFSRFHARMTCTLVTRLPGVKAPSPMSGSSPASTAQRAALAVSGSATSL